MSPHGRKAQLAWDMLWLVLMAVGAGMMLGAGLAEPILGLAIAGYLLCRFASLMSAR